MLKVYCTGIDDLCFAALCRYPVMCLMCQMLPSRPTPPLRRTLKTLAWTHLPISPSGPPLSRRVGQLGLLCHRVKNRRKRWDVLRTLSSPLSVTRPPAAVLTRMTTLPASGPSPRRVPLVSPRIWTPHPCAFLLSHSPSPHLRWSRRCGTANTSPPRTPSSLRLRGLSLRRL